MTIIATDAAHTAAKLEAQAAALRETITGLNADAWKFFDDCWIDPAPYQGKIPYDFQRGVRVHRSSSRCIHVTLTVDDMAAAVTYVSLYTKRAPISKVGDGHTVADLPSTILDYSYERKDPSCIKHTVFGDVAFNVHARNNHEADNALEFYMVQDESTTSRYVKVTVRLHKSHIKAHAAYGENFKLCGAPIPSNHLVQHGEKPKFNSHHDITDGYIDATVVLPAGGNVLDWMPKEYVESAPA